MVKKSLNNEDATIGSLQKHEKVIEQLNTGIWIYTKWLKIIEQLSNSIWIYSNK